MNMDRNLNTGFTLFIIVRFVQPSFIAKELKKKGREKQILFAHLFLVQDVSYCIDRKKKRRRRLKRKEQVNKINRRNKNNKEKKPWMDAGDLYMDIFVARFFKADCSRLLACGPAKQRLRGKKRE